VEDDNLEQGERVLVLNPLPRHDTQRIGNGGRQSSHAVSTCRPSPRRRRPCRSTMWRGGPRDSRTCCVCRGRTETACSAARSSTKPWPRSPPTRLLPRLRRPWIGCRPLLPPWTPLLLLCAGRMPPSEGGSTREEAEEDGRRREALRWRMHSRREE
jgi:hypothetical protein